MYLNVQVQATCTAKSVSCARLREPFSRRATSPIGTQDGQPWTHGEDSKSFLSCQPRLKAVRHADAARCVARIGLRVASGHVLFMCAGRSRVVSKASARGKPMIRHHLQHSRTMPAHMIAQRMRCAHVFVIVLWLGCVCGVSRMGVGVGVSHHCHMMAPQLPTCPDPTSPVLCVNRSSVRPQWMGSLFPVRAACG